MIAYYIEKETGDFLSVDCSTASYYRRIGKPDMREARTTAIAGNIASVCTTGVSRSYLRQKCNRVEKAVVPQSWMNRF